MQRILFTCFAVSCAFLAACPRAAIDVGQLEPDSAVAETGGAGGGSVVVTDPPAIGLDGATGLGGAIGEGGATEPPIRGVGGAIGTGGATVIVPVPGTGGTPDSGGATVIASGGATGSGGVQGTGGQIRPESRLPCDIYASEGGPCVAAHSTVRALLAAYAGPLYQVKRSDGTVKDIPQLFTGSFADSSVQDAFCSNDRCTISVIYDQSGKGNHLTAAPGGGAKRTPDNEADAAALPVTLAGHKVYGEHAKAGTGYRNNATSGIATGDNPETIYMIVSGDYYNSACCFDYGNAETNGYDNGEGAAEAVYFGNCTIWGKGAGNGPWVMADLENGLWPGNDTPNLSNLAMGYKYVTGMLKGDAAGKNHWALKAGNAQSSPLVKLFDGARPNARYNPMRKEGAIILNTAGDNSAAGQGNFFEGAMTAHYSSDAADDLVQANIVSVYGQ